MENVIFGDAYFKRIKKVCIVEILANIFLAIIKFIGGFLTMNFTLISDGFNSFGDIFTCLIALFSNKAASKKADADHQFGHELIESLVSLIVSIVLFMLALFLAYKSVLNIINKEYLESDNSNLIIALIMVISALVVKGLLFIFTYISSKRLKSQVLKVQAIDHLSDSLSTFVSLVSVLTLFFITNDSLKIIDPILSLVVDVIVGFSLLKIAIESGSSLLDKAVDKDLENKIRNSIMSVNGVEHIDTLRSRKFSNRILLEIEISCSKTLSLEEAHNISEEVRQKIINEFKEVKHISIHVNPSDHKDESHL